VRIHGLYDGILHSLTDEAVHRNQSHTTEAIQPGPETTSHDAECVEWRGFVLHGSGYDGRRRPYLVWAFPRLGRVEMGQDATNGGRP